MKATGHRIPVSAIEPAVDFYQTLGFDCTFQAEEYGWASMTHGDFQLGLYKPGMGGGTRQPGENVGFLLQVDDLDALHVQCAEHGLTPSDIAESNDGKRLFDVTDPDGNQLTFTD